MELYVNDQFKPFSSLRLDLSLLKLSKLRGDKEFRLLLEKVWVETQTTGYELYKLKEKLKTLKEEMRAWNVNQNGDVYKNIKSKQEISTKEETTKEVSTSLFKVAKATRLGKSETPGKIKLLSEPWTPVSVLVSAALKLKIEIIRKTFSEEY